jgi:phosphoglycolate phosphatase-like HAD superfamily hydrolase
LLERTFRTFYGVPDASLAEIEADGMLTTQVIVEVLRLHRVEEDFVRSQMDMAFRFMHDYFTLHEDEDVYMLMPGVSEILTEFAQHGVPLGLLTGNIEAIAWKRLARAGIAHFFAFGSFGDMAYKRADLVPLAWARARDRCAITTSLDDFVIIGDTPADVACAKAAGIQSIAIAAGGASPQQLAVAGADLVVASLHEREEVFRFLQLS